MNGNQVAFPLSYSGRIPKGSALKEAEVEMAMSTHTCSVRVAKVSAQFMKKIESELCTTCTVDGVEIPLLFPPRVAIEPGPIPGDDPRGKEQFEGFLAENKDMFERLSLFAGFFGLDRILIRFERGDAQAPFPVRSRSELDVLIFTGPISSVDKKTMKSIGGMPINGNDKGRPVLMSHCPIRGGVLIEGEQVLMQYIDNTIYTLFHPSTLVERGGIYATDCYLDALINTIALWRAKKTGYEDADASLKPTFLPVDGEGVATEFARAEKKVRDECTREIGDLNERIRKQEKELLRLRREVLVLQKQCTMPLLFSNAAFVLDEARRDELLESVRRFSVHPLVEKLQIVSDLGIHLLTKEVVITHESQRYRIGTFSALFHYDGNISVWATTTHHPDGVPHPHIERDTGMCLGNVSDAIRRALAEFRFGDAIEFFLVSLEEGYTHENVLFHPVTEWPIVCKEEA